MTKKFSENLRLFCQPSVLGQDSAQFNTFTDWKLSVRNPCEVYLYRISEVLQQCVGFCEQVSFLCHKRQ